jgi:hypothetical protein
MYELFGFSGEGAYGKTMNLNLEAVAELGFIGSIELLYVNFSPTKRGPSLIAIHTPGFPKLYFKDPNTAVFEPVPNGGEHDAFLNCSSPDFQFFENRFACLLPTPRRWGCEQRWLRPEGVPSWIQNV